MKRALIVLFLSSVLGSSGLAQAPQSQSNRAEAYFHFSKARLLDEQGQSNQAIEEYKKALEIDPGNSLIYSEIAESYLRNRRVRDAVDAAQKAIQLDANNIEAHKLLSTVYVQVLGNANQQPISQETIDNAIHEFEEIVRLDPTESQAYLMLGRLYQIKNEPQKAAEIYDKFLGLEPGSEEGISALARLQIDNGNNEEAVRLLEKFLESNPDSADVLETLGQAHLNLEHFDKAVEAYRKVLATDPDNVDLKKALAQSLFLSDQLDDAAQIYQDLLRLDSNDGTALLRLGQIFRRQRKLGQAHVYMQKAVQAFPDSIDVQFNMMLLERDEGLLEEAIQRLSDILKGTAKPNGRYSESEKQTRALFLTHQGQLNFTIGRWDDAVTAFSELKAVNPDDGRADEMIVETYRGSKNLDKALEYCEQALKQSPENRQLQVLHADIIAEKGRVNEGIQALQKLTKGDDKDLDVLSRMANIYQKAKQYNQAENVVHTAVQRFPNDEQAYFLQGSIYEKQKKYADAEQAFRKALEIKMDDPAILNYLGYMLANRGVKLEEAVELTQKAVDQEPINGAYLDSLGWAYYRLNKLDLAEEYLKKALIFAGTDATVNDHMGDLYYKTQRYEMAKAAWTRSVQLSDDPEEIEQVKKKLDELKTKVAKN
jgi:tetratricopeptide (TPR) repeat protein